jgi:hypothetical protein
MPGGEIIATAEWTVCRVYGDEAFPLDATVVLRRDVANDDGDWSDRLSLIRLRLPGGVEGHLNELLLRPAQMVSLLNVLASSEGKEMLDWILSLCSASPLEGTWSTPRELVDGIEEGESLNLPAENERDSDDDGDDDDEDESSDEDELEDDPQGESLAPTQHASVSAVTSDSWTDHDYARATNEQLIEYAHKHWQDEEILSKINVQFMSDREPESWTHIAANVKQIQSRVRELVRAQYPQQIGQDGSGTGGLHWPMQAVQSSSVALKSDCYWYKDGVLSFMGYHVGESSELSPDQRRRILDYVYGGRIPNVNDPAYMSQWGAPASSRRLRKMADSLANFARSAKRNTHVDKRVAISEWESDLVYLRQRYYRLGIKHLWRWPSTGRPQ